MSNALTVTEKEHWKSRIEKRLNDQIERIYLEQLGFKEKIDTAAHKAAVKSLGIADMLAKRSTLEEEIKKREKQKDELEKRIAQTVFPDGNQCYYWVKDEVCKHTDLYRNEVLGKSRRGKRILALETEKENLLDTVWLATSSKQIKDLWAQVDRLLGETPSKLQSEALKIEPIEEQ